MQYIGDKDGEMGCKSMQLLLKDVAWSFYGIGLIINGFLLFLRNWYSIIIITHRNGSCIIIIVIIRVFMSGIGLILYRLPMCVS